MKFCEDHLFISTKLQPFFQQEKSKLWATFTISFKKQLKKNWKTRTCQFLLVYWTKAQVEFQNPYSKKQLEEQCYHDKGEMGSRDTALSLKWKMIIQIRVFFPCNIRALRKPTNMIIFLIQIKSSRARFTSSSSPKKAALDSAIHHYWRYRYQTIA